MRESISYTFLLNIIIVFITISFFAIMGIMSYAKSFRVNSKIVNSIEVNEGYNNYSMNTISQIFTSYGYQKISIKCPQKSGQNAINIDSNGKTSDGVCVYLFDNGNTYSYGVVTYMSLNFPVIGGLARIPIYTKTMVMHKLG